MRTGGQTQSAQVASCSLTQVNKVMVLLTSVLDLGDKEDITIPPPCICWHLKCFLTRPPNPREQCVHPSNYSLTFAPVFS